MNFNRPTRASLANYGALVIGKHFHCPSNYVILYTVCHKSQDQFHHSVEKVVQKSCLSRGKLKMQPAV